MRSGFDALLLQGLDVAGVTCLHLGEMLLTDCMADLLVRAFKSVTRMYVNSCSANVHVVPRLIFEMPALREVFVREGWWYTENESHCFWSCLSFAQKERMRLQGHMVKVNSLGM